MVKCPFCQFENEDGALFCDQCKSDLGMAEAVVAAAQAVPAAEAEVPVAAPIVAEAAPVIATAVPEAEARTPLEDTIPFANVESEVAAEPELEERAPAAPAVQAAEAAAEAAAATVEATTPAAEEMPAAAPEAQPAEPAEAPTALPAGAQLRLVVLRGLKLNTEYPLYEGLNFIGRTDEKPVDIDLEDQEPPDRIWSSRQHACISLENGVLAIEDLNSANGTFVNRTRVYPGQKRQLNLNDVVQIGTVQMRVKS